MSAISYCVLRENFKSKITKILNCEKKSRRKLKSRIKWQNQKLKHIKRMDNKCHIINVWWKCTRIPTHYLLRIINLKTHHRYKDWNFICARCAFRLQKTHQWCSNVKTKRAKYTTKLKSSDKTWKHFYSLLAYLYYWKSFNSK